jgi:hypothetical protein
MHISLLNVNRTDDEAIDSFHAVGNSISGFISRLSIELRTESIGADKLQLCEAASTLLNRGNDRLARISFIGPYISERLNIRLESESDKPIFASLCHADINLDAVCSALINT